MKTLVTGGGGFLGRYIVEQLLDRGDDVTVFARGNYPELVEIGAKFIRGDLQDAEAVHQACQGLDAVFHVAAKAGYWGTWESFYGPNVTGTQNVIAACRKQGVPKLINTSSPSVIFEGQPHFGADESLPYPTHYDNLYSHTKAIAEQLVTKANGADLLTVSLRPHVVWGPRDTQFIPRLIDRAKRGRAIQVGNGTNKVDATYVEDAARAHLLAADALEPGSPVAGSVYFISQDDPVNLWGFFGKLAAGLDLPPIKRSIPLPIARAIGTTLEFTYRTLQLKGEPLFTRSAANLLALSHYYDISRAKQDFGYTPQFTIEEGLRRTVEYFKERSYR